MEKAAAEVEELPRAVVRRVVKEKLSRCSDGADINVHKDALLAFSESARIFIHYLSATANDVCKEAKRQTVNADDVFKALEETEFTEFIGPLKASLEEFRQKNTGKKAETSKTKEGKKRKIIEEQSQENGRDGNQQDGGEEDKEDKANCPSSD